MVLVVLFAATGALLAYDSSQSDMIAKGVTVGGVNVGGLSVSQARKRLHAAYQRLLNDPIVLRGRGQRFVITPRAARVAVDIDASVQQALARSRQDNIFVRVFRSLTDGQIHANVDPRLQFSTAAMNSLVTKVTQALNQPARDASLSWSGDQIGTTPSETGIAVRSALLTQQVGDALAHPRGPRTIQIPLAVTQPKVKTSQLAAEYPTIITIDRSAFTLRLWKHLHQVSSYTIAVGMQGLETPAGLYRIEDKEVDPSWHVPNSSWAGSLAGQVIPPGPEDPLKARWMGVANGAGIHGTEDLGSLGTAASHGCIRMSVPDVIQLYGETPLGTPVYIS